MKIKRIAIVFVIAFILALAVLNFGIIKEYTRFIGIQIADIFRNEPEQIISTPRPEPRLFPVTDPNDLHTLKPLPAEARIVIPKIGTNAPLVFNIPNDNNQIFDALKNGVVQHPISAKPGREGMSILLGHSSAPLGHYEYGNVFTLLGNLNAGDTFYIEYADGQRFNYEIQEKFKFNPFDLSDPNLYKLESIKYDGVTLVTCWPIGTNLQRQAVLAKEI
ncbi:MAG: sortase [Parcubacteria group bacterium]